MNKVFVQTENKVTMHTSGKVYAEYSAYVSLWDRDHTCLDERRFDNLTIQQHFEFKAALFRLRRRYSPMKHLVLRPATMIEFEPGDATRYMAFYAVTHGGENVYVALGAGETVTMGYYLPVDQLRVIANKFTIAVESDALVNIVSDTGLPAYYRGHIYTHEVNPWTSVVAVLLGMIIAFGDPTEQYHLDLIGHVYRNKAAEVKAVMEDMWSVRSVTIGSRNED